MLQSTALALAVSPLLPCFRKLIRDFSKPFYPPFENPWTVVWSGVPLSLGFVRWLVSHSEKRTSAHRPYATVEPQAPIQNDLRWRLRHNTADFDP